MEKKENEEEKQKKKKKGELKLKKSTHQKSNKYEKKRQILSSNIMNLTNSAVTL